MPRSGLLEKLRTSAEMRFIPILRPSAEEMLLTELGRVKPKRILEIGTAIGYSGILMLQNSEAKLTTIEVDKTRFDEAVDTFRLAGVACRAEAILGDAEEVLCLMDKSFDFIFIDAAKGQYATYLALVDPLLAPGGTIVADNIEYHSLLSRAGTVPHKHRTIVTNMRKFLAEVENNPNYRSRMYPEVGDGILVMEKRFKQKE